MHVEHPLVLTAIGALAIAWRPVLRARLPHPLSTPRALAAAAIGLALCGIAVDRGDAPMSAIVAIDRSDSMPPDAVGAALKRSRTLAGAMREEDRLGFVVFGADAVVAAPPGPRLDVAQPTTSVDPTGTDIERGIRTARSALSRSSSRRIVLISDGRETAGHAERAAADAGAEGIPIDVVMPPSDTHGAGIRVLRVMAPSDVHVDEPFTISIALEGAPGSGGDVILYRDGAAVTTRHVAVGAQGAASIDVDATVARGGIYRYAATVVAPTGDDLDRPVPSDDAAVVNVAGAQRVAYVSTGGTRSTPESPSFQVRHLSPETLPNSIEGFAAYDAVVLDDVPAERLTPSQTAALAAHVRDGGAGLIVLGGASAFDAAGYAVTPLSDVLPVDFRPRAGRRAPSLDLVLMFDRSGSMSEQSDGLPKIEAAREAVRRVVDMMPPGDALGIIAFNASPLPIAPLAPVSSVQAILDSVDRIEPTGSTAIAPAADLALKWLADARGRGAARRQLLLISDGRTSETDAGRLRELARTSDVAISAVAIGSNADAPLLRDLAATTGGRAFFPDDVRELPLIVAREAARSLSGTVVRESFVPSAATHALLRGVDTRSIPALGGYVVSAARRGAVSVLASHLDDPVLCAWQAGLGRAAVITADLNARGSVPFVRWREWPELWTHVVRWAARRTDDPSLIVAIADKAGRPSVVIAASDPALPLPEIASAVVRGPDGASRDVALTRTEPGRFEAPLDHAATGTYIVSAQVTGSDGSERRIVRGASWNADRERASGTPDVALLERIAAVSGGRILGPDDTPFAMSRPSRRLDLSAWLATAALLIFVLELVAPRVAFRFAFDHLRRTSSAHAAHRG